MRRVVLLLLVVAAVGVAAGLLPNPLLTTSSAFNGEVATGMAAVYASLRVLKGVMMMAADANFSAGVAVVGFEGSPGQLVTPVIDTVERMANLVFALLVAAGLLAVLLPILGQWAAAFIASAAAILLLVGMMPRGGRLAEGVGAGARAVLFAGLIGAVLIPGAYTLASLVADNYVPTAGDTNDLDAMVAPYEESATVTAPTQAPAPAGESAPAEQAPTGQSFWDYVGSQIGGVIASIGSVGSGMTEAVQNLGAGTLDQVSRSISSVGHAIERAQELLQLLISLSVAYILKLFVLPLLVTLIVIVVVRSGFRAAMRPAPQPSPPAG